MALSSPQIGINLTLAWKSSTETSVSQLDQANAAMAAATTPCYFNFLLVGVKEKDVGFSFWFETKI